MPSAPTRSASAPSDAVAELVDRHPEVVTAARVGWVAKGVLYVVLGVLAGSLVVGSGGGGGEEVSQSGAVQELASTPLGTIGLWLVAIGLVLHVVWRLASVLLPAESSAKVWAIRVGYVASAIAYGALAWTAASLAMGGSGGEDQESQVDEVTRTVMEATAGRWLIGLAGLVIVGVGVAFVHRGWTRGFTDELKPGGVGPVDQQTLHRLGVIGWIGRGLMLLIVGWFVLQAALRFDPEEAKGIDGALRDVTEASWGPLLVGLVAVGLIAFGVYSVLSAPRTQLRPPG